MTKIIGILGFKGSGKDTVGDYLVRQHGYQVESFANPLKDLLAAIFGWDRALLEGNTVDSRTWRETPDEWWEAKLDWKSSKFAYLGRFTPRVAMQVIGTDTMREHFDNDIWIKSLESRLRGKERVVVTDCRFPNECGLIRDLQGLIMRVKRGPEPIWFDVATHACLGLEDAKRHMATEFQAIHISEWAWLTQSYQLIENDGTIADLYGKVEWHLTNHSLKY